MSESEICQCNHAQDDHAPINSGDMACAGSMFCDCQKFEKRKNTADYTDLGTENGWTDYPIEYIDCQEKYHTRRRINVGNCLNDYFCDTCKFFYRVDSSG